MSLKDDTLDPPDSDLGEPRRIWDEHYRRGRLLSLVHLSQGKVNLSYKVEAESGVYVLQRLHPVFGSRGEVVENVDAASRSLVRAGLGTAVVLPTVAGRLWAEDQYQWRLMSWVGGRPVGKKTPVAAGEAARFLGRFHQALYRFPPELKPLARAEYNREGPAPASAWERVINAFQDDSGYREAAADLDRGRNLAAGLPLLPFETKGTVHGDPKLDNYLFDDSGRALALIDLDSIRRGSLLWELADGLRSWTGVRTEDGLVSFDRAIYFTAARSYLATGLKLTPQEWRNLPAAVRAVALNLARRYFQDYFEQKYFAWDRTRFPSLAAQNLHRGRGMLRLAGDLAADEDVLRTAVGEERDRS